MTILTKITAWVTSRRTWAVLVLFIASLGAAWLSAVHSGSTDYSTDQVKYRPLASPHSESSEEIAADTVRHPLDDALEFVQPTIEALANVHDYTAVFTKTELLQGRLLTQNMDMKFRQKPFSVYFHGHSKCKQGREVIYVAGRHESKLVVHEVGLKAIVGTMHLSPDDPKVMATNRYPITNVGIAKIIDSAIEIWKNEKKTQDPANIEVRIVRDIEVGSIECDAVEISHRHEQEGLNYQIGRVYVDKVSRLPVQAELYGWPATPGDDPPLLEQYTYTNLKTNVGLSDADFDPQNGDYRFDVSARD
jgi:hypothetical protein